MGVDPSWDTRCNGKQTLFTPHATCHIGCQLTLFNCNFEFFLILSTSAYSPSETSYQYVQLGLPRAEPAAGGPPRPIKTYGHEEATQKEARAKYEPGIGRI